MSEIKRPIRKRNPKMGHFRKIPQEIKQRGHFLFGQMSDDVIQKMRRLGMKI